VDGLEREFNGRLTVIHIDVLKPTGKELGEIFDFKYTPTFVFFDVEGKEVWRTIGAINPAKVRDFLDEE